MFLIFNTLKLGARVRLLLSDEVCIYIATPYNLHLENTLHALNHNKHVLCEKPMGINQREESIMIEKTKEKLTPLFISSIKRTHFIGILMFLSCLVTALFYKQYLTSVWCFFAA
jgi:hypothetical protein